MRRLTALVKEEIRIERTIKEENPEGLDRYRLMKRQLRVLRLAIRVAAGEVCAEDAIQAKKILTKQ